MLELLALFAAGAALVGGHWQTRRFVGRRLQFVDAVHRGHAPLVAGTAAAVVAAPVVWVLPVIGTGTALLFGVGVATGIAAGARDLRRRLGSG